MRSDSLIRGEAGLPVFGGPQGTGFLVTRCLLVMSLVCLTNCRNVKSYRVDSISFRNTTSSFPQVPPNAQPAVQQSSQCFWAGASEEIDFSWEAIAATTVFLSDTDRRQISVGTCHEENADTGGDTFPQLDGATITGYLQGHYQAVASTIPTKFLTCPGPAMDANPFGECRDLHQDCIDPSKCTCQDVANPCGSTRQTNFPFCANNCAETPASDTAFEVVPVGFMPLSVAPNFYRVQGMRTVARMMTFNTDRQAFVFPADPNAPLVDNFSSNLLISRVRAFVPAPTGPANTRQYLTLARVQVARHALGSPSPLNFGTLCNPDSADTTQVTIGACPALKDEVPTYSKSQVGSPPQFTTWKVEFPKQNVPSGPVDQSSTVFIEFTLIDPKSGGLAAATEPTMAPSSYTFNNVLPRTGLRVVPAAFTVTDDLWTEIWTVDSIGTTGPNASDFSAAVHGSRPPTLSIGAMDSFSIDLTLNTNTASSSKSANLVVAMHSSSGRNVTLTGQINAYPPPLTMNVEPKSLYFNQGNQPLPWRRAVLIANDGNWPITLGIPTAGAITPPGGVSISSSGTDQFAFRTYAQDGTSPVASVTLQAGQSEVIYVFFCPKKRDTPFNAQLVVAANVSQTLSTPVWQTPIIPLQGYVSESANITQCFATR